jgi:NADH-quinone oxidoreductase subunit B
MPMDVYVPSFTPRPDAFWQGLILLVEAVCNEKCILNWILGPQWVIKPGLIS